ADNQSGNPGDTLPLPLNATNSGGTGIALWRIITDGSNGATLNLAGDLSSPPDDAAISIPTGGTAGPTLTLGPDAGSVSIEACEGQLQTMGYVCINPPSFHTFAAVALPKMLVKVTPDPVSADVGSSFDVSVRLEDGLGNPVAGSSISFAATPGVVSPANTSAVTGAGGVATASFSADQAGSFPSAMSVIYDPDGIPSNGNELLATYGFSFATPAPGILNKPSVNSGDNQTLTVGDRIAMPLRVLARTGAGTPEANVTVNWSVLQGAAQLDAASTLTDSSGYTGMGLVATAAGTIVVRAERADVPAAYEEFTLSALAPASLSIEGGDGQVASPGSTGDDLVVQLLLDGSPFGGGQIAWAVESGDATLTDSHSGTDAGGLARVGISFGTGVGPVVVSASSEDPPAGPVYFHLDVAPPSSIVHLEIHAGDHQNGPITTAGDNPLVVSLTDGDGAPIDDATVYWEVIGGDASVDGVSSSTEGGGFAAMTFRFGAAAGASTIRASLTGGDIYRDFEVTAYVPQLIQQGGDGQSGLTGSELPEDFVVSIAPPVSPIAKSLTGVDIHWQVIEGGGSLSATTTPTDGDGQARVRLRLGPAPGNNVVRAEIAGGPTLLFNATGYNTPPAAMLRIVSGDGQQIPTTSPSAPLVVETLDGDDEPLSGVALDWSIDNGSLSAASTSTGSDGQSSNVAQVAISGTAVVNVAVHGSPELAVSFTLNGGVANILDLTDDEHEVAVAIDTLCPALLAMDSHTPEQHDLLERCLELLDNAGDHPDDVVHALDEMMQDTALVQAHSALLAASTQFGNINQRLNALRAGRQQPLSLDGLSLANSSGIMPLALLPEAGDGETGTDFSRWGFFANGTLGRGDSDGGRSRPQYDYDTSGLTAGVDYRVNDHWFAGVALGYTRQDNSLGDDQGRVDMRGWSVSGYTTWFNTHNWYVDAVLNWGSNDYDMQRRIAYQIAGSGGITRVDQVAQASSSGDQSYAALSFGRDFQKGAWSIGPYLRASWARVSFDAYQESLPGSGAGSGLGLAVAARDVDAAMLVLGGKASRAISTDWGVLMPSLSLEWEHQLQDDPQHVVAHFLADPTRTPFEIRGTPLDRDYYRLGIGLSALWANGRSGFVSYEHLIGASGISQGTLSLGLRFEF
ncbi:MAG: autotransporter domain-containing protein, partial [Xanthomonadales bacterium]|nr:autotransporter domain-containing protein [Xanthomonadales bacterium]